MGTRGKGEGQPESKAFSGADVDRVGMGEEWKGGKEGVEETVCTHSSRMEFLTYAAGMSGMQDSLI